MYIIIACITVGVTLCGIGAVSDKATVNRNDDCRLYFPENRLFAPVVIDEILHEELVPTQNNEGNGSFWCVNVAPKKKIKVNCGSGNTLSIHGTYTYMQLTCVIGTKFRDDHGTLIFLPDGISCANPRKPAATVYRNGTCFKNGTRFDVDLITENPPLKFYTVCMDEQTSASLYSSSYIDGASMAKGLGESGGNRPDFRGTEFYPFPIKQAYKWENLWQHLSSLLGSEEKVHQYFPSQPYRFSRGHLFPNADAVKQFEKHATFYYLNTVPQWQVLNAGNWALIEQDVRDLAKKLGTTLNVVTGAFGVTTLPDSNNNDVELWIARDRTGQLRVPVPRFVWKVIQNPAAGEAVAVVQVNNPWVVQRDRDILCNDVCGNLKWLRSSEYHKIRKGYSYCCDVIELRQVIPYVPEVEYTNLLKVL